MNHALPARPDLRFLFAHPAHFLALGAGCGLSRLGPGTVGTLWAWATFVLLDSLAAPTDLQWAGLIGLALLGGWWASEITARHLGVADPGSIVIDEIAAFWLVLWLILPAGLAAQMAAFLLFRFFDAVKPGPVAWADQQFKGIGGAGAWGIMWDDLVAAFCTLLVVAWWRF